jgi:hypothetical protein
VRGSYISPASIRRRFVAAFLRAFSIPRTLVSYQFAESLKFADQNAAFYYVHCGLGSQLLILAFQPND